MGILDGIVDWLATQVMNLLDLASTSVLGAFGCNMDTFKRYFPAASAMYEIFIWTAIGLVLRYCRPVRLLSSSRSTKTKTPAGVRRVLLFWWS